MAFLVLLIPNLVWRSLKIKTVYYSVIE